MRRRALALVTAVAMLTAGVMVTRAAGDPAGSRSNYEGLATTTVADIVDAAYSSDGATAARRHAPICPGGPSPRDLIEARDAVVCLRPVANIRIDWAAAVVRIDLDTEEIPDLDTIATGANLDAGLVDFVPPGNFSNLAGCLPP